MRLHAAVGAASIQANGAPARPPKGKAGGRLALLPIVIGGG